MEMSAPLPALVLAILLGNPLAAQDTRAPAPDAAAQKEAEKSIRDVFKDEYAKRSTADKTALAKKLLEQGIQTKDDPASQFVLFRESRDAAAQAGDVETAMQAIDELAARFAVDAPSMRSAAVATISKNAKSPEELTPLAKLLLKSAEDALAKDQFDAAEKGIESAIALAKRAKDVPLVARAEVQKKVIADFKAKFEKVKKSKEVLASTPNDPPASTLVGEYECLQKGNWKDGLPLLAQGSDSALKTLAQRDLAKPEGAAEQAAVADGWWDLGEKLTGNARDQAKARALGWYESSVPRLTGLAKAKVDQRLAALRAEKLAAGDWIDVSDPRLFGQGGKAGDPVTVTAVPGAALQLPLEKFPKGEFDGFSVRARQGEGDVMSLVIFEGDQRAATLSASRVRFGLAHAQGVKSWNHDIDGPVAKRGECVMTVLLKEGHYVAYMDGQELGKVKTAELRISNLTLRSENGPTRFDQIRLRRKP
jgi:hypothetical protein